VEIAEATRNADYIKLGVSPRGSIALFRMAKAYAYVMGRNYVVPDDIKELAPYVLAHRMILTPKGKSVVANSEEAIERILETIAVPLE
jgi:MoxR-like ATPase